MGVRTEFEPTNVIALDFNLNCVAKVRPLVLNLQLEIYFITYPNKSSGYRRGEVLIEKPSPHTSTQAPRTYLSYHMLSNWLGNPTVKKGLAMPW